MEQTTLREKLFSIATRKRKIQNHSAVLLPTSLAPIPTQLLFRTDKPRRRVLELGCGWGEFLYGWLQRHPQDDYIAFEVKADRIRKSLSYLQRLNASVHLRILPINFNWFLEELLPSQSFDLVIINFPDPWPKKRHWKHRLIQANFTKRLSKLIRTEAKIYIATDYSPYARRILHVFRQSKTFRSIHPWPHYLRKHDETMPYTRFEMLHLTNKKSPYYFCWQYI